MLKRSNLIHLLLFILTFLSTLAAGTMQKGIDPFKEPERMGEGFPFAFTLMLILLCHELAHYFASRAHRTDATLPYFIPAPSIFGTFGAFIKMKSPIITRKALVDIGASGPIAGFVVSVFAAIIGLMYSEVIVVEGDMGAMSLGDSLLFSFLARLVLGVPPEGHDILLHPVAFAGWIGFFVTSLNLIPIGQLDGGHVVYAILGEKHGRLSMGLVVVLVALGAMFWLGWGVWAVLMVVLGLRHPPVVYWEPVLDPRRKLIGWISLVIFIITFIPVPITVSF
jgi:membrane-associated protease RseP (regulator of RpoE activity)